MASKRMFNTQIIGSDAFLSMPLSSQALYFHLGMNADDDGFLNNPIQIARAINASQDDMNLLLVKKFIIRFDSGVMVIKHWRMNNWIRADRKKETVYQNEYRLLNIREDGAYTFNNLIEKEKTPLNKGSQPSVSQLSAQISISVDESSIEQYNERSNNNDLHFMEQLNKDVKKNTTFESLEKLIKNNFLTPKRDLTEVEARQLFDWVSEYPRNYLEHIISDLCLISTDKRNFRYLKAVIIKAYDTWSDKPIETPSIKEVQPEVELDDVFAELKALKEKGKK
jgi:hypothetical protein